MTLTFHPNFVVAQYIRNAVELSDLDSDVANFVTNFVYPF